MDKQASDNFFQQLDSLWIKPEIERRTLAQTLPADFKIYRCLIKMPHGKEPIVEFNDEIVLTAKFEAAPGENIQAGNPVFLHQVKKIESVKPPEVDGVRVAFVYLYWNGNHYETIFDFTPNVPDELITPEQKELWNFGEAIGKSIQNILSERAINIQGNSPQLFNTIGLWAAPALIPYPLTKIAVELDKGNFDVALKALIEHCNDTFLRTLIDKWYDHNIFVHRKTLIEDAFFAHQNQKYTLSINALIPQIEGVITDWMYSNVDIDDNSIPWRQESKTKKFREEILNGQISSYSYKAIVESTLNFILDGPVLDTFKKWEQNVNTAFPNRHVVEHGKYIDDLYKIENSIRLFLLLDTISYIMNK